MNRDIDQRARNPGHGIFVVIREEVDTQESLFLQIGRDAKLLFGLAIALIEIVITDRPIHKLGDGWIIRFHLEIRRDEPQAGSEPMLRPAGEAIIGAGKWPWALLN